MVIFIFIMILFGLAMVAAILENYGTDILDTIKRTCRIILPKNKGVQRLCFVLSITLSVVAFIEIPKYSGISDIVCGGKRSCHILGEPSWITAVVAFCVPFVVAKIVEFIINGFREQ